MGATLGATVGAAVEIPWLHPSTELVHGLFVHPSIPLSASDRFAMVIDGLCRAVAARGSERVMSSALIILIWTRLRRCNVRFQALVVQIITGALRAGSAGPRGAKAQATPAAPRVCRPILSGIERPVVPRGFAWLLVLVPTTAAGFASQLRHLLTDPEMVALLSATPQMGELLRPLCRMLGLDAALLMPRPGPVADALAVETDGEVLHIANPAWPSRPDPARPQEAGATSVSVTWLTFST